MRWNGSDSATIRAVISNNESGWRTISVRLGLCEWRCVMNGHIWPDIVGWLLFGWNRPWQQDIFFYFTIRRLCFVFLCVFFSLLIGLKIEAAIDSCSGVGPFCWCILLSICCCWPNLFSWLTSIIQITVHRFVSLQFLPFFSFVWE